jgi:hypothetical protein
MVFVVGLMTAASAAAADSLDYRVLGTSRASTMEKELNEAAEAGFHFSKVTAGTNALGGKELMVVTVKDGAASTRDARQYKVLTAARTSTLENQLQQAADDGYEYVDQAMFVSGVGGRQLAFILERDPAKPRSRSTYRLIGAAKASTLQKELNGLGAQGYVVVGFTVGVTTLGGEETVVILRKD